MSKSEYTNRANKESEENNGVDYIKTEDVYDILGDIEYEIKEIRDNLDELLKKLW